MSPHNSGSDWAGHQAKQRLVPGIGPNVEGPHSFGSQRFKKFSEGALPAQDAAVPSTLPWTVGAWPGERTGEFHGIDGRFAVRQFR